MRYVPSIVLVVLLAVTPVQAHDAELAMVVARAHLALAHVLGSDTPDSPDSPDVPDTPDSPDTPHTPACECGGTGMVLSGDGLVRVPCPCPSPCRCGPARRATSVVTRQVIVLTNPKRCQPCRPLERQLAALRAAGWVVNDSPTAQVRVLNPDTKPEFYTLVDSDPNDGIPQLYLYENGRRRSRLMGAPLGLVTAYDIAEMLQPGITKTQPPPVATTPAPAGGILQADGRRLRTDLPPVRYQGSTPLYRLDEPNNPAVQYYGGRRLRTDLPPVGYQGSTPLYRLDP